jgi:hypothetical protein
MFLNFLPYPARTDAAYTPANYARLRAIKRAYDPGNVFRLGHKIPPAPKGAPGSLTGSGGAARRAGPPPPGWSSFPSGGHGRYNRLICVALGVLPS